MTTALVNIAVQISATEVARSRPSGVDVRNAMLELGYEHEEVDIFYALFAKAAKTKRGWVRMDMSTHDLLDSIMPDLAIAMPGSVHELINRHFLDEGEVFVHDKNIYCIIQRVSIF